MSKLKKRKPATRNTASGKPDIQSALIKCLKAAGIALLFLLILLSILAFVYWKKEVSFKTLQVLAFIFSGVSFLLCGFLAVRKNKIPAVYASGGAGLLVLLVVIALLAILSGGNMSNLVWILVAVGLVCPFLGGVLARKI